MDSNKIAVFDTTLRDVEQSPGCSMYLEEKIEMAEQLERLGVDVIEAGFPIASDGDFRALQAVSSRCRTATIAGLARTIETDIVRAGEALRGARRSRIHTFVATSDIHMQYKLNTRGRGRILCRGRDPQRYRIYLRSIRGSG